MYLPDIELHEATGLDQACALLARYAPSVRLLAGGTDLLVDLKTGRFQVDHVVSINHLDGLCDIAMIDGELHIGALATITQLGRSPVVRRHFASLLDATSQMASLQIRNMATAGGNVASAVPCADLPPILLVLGASVALRSTATSRQVALDSFFLGPRQTAKGDDEVLTAIHVPAAPPAFGAAYERFALREGNAIAVAGVAASLQLGDGGTIRRASIALGSVAPTPKLVVVAGEQLIGESPCEEAFSLAAEAATQAAEPISDIRASADFRREVVRVLTRRALATAHQRASQSMREHSASPKESS